MQADTHGRTFAHDTHNTRLSRHSISEMSRKKKIHEKNLSYNSSITFDPLIVGILP